MQMLRARCVKCQWVYDIIALPIPVAAILAMANGQCPMCGNVKGNVLADPRPLTDAETAHKSGVRLEVPA